MSAMQWLVSQGATVSLPFGHSPHYDLVADFSGLLIRVQVKTSRYFVNDRWQVTLCTRGGNQSWGGTGEDARPEDLRLLARLRRRRSALVHPSAAVRWCERPQPGRTEVRPIRSRARRGDAAPDAPIVRV